MRRPALASAALLTAAALVVGAPSAFAATGLGAGALDSIVNAFNGVSAFAPTLLSQAQLLFAGLAAIEFTLVIGRQMLGRADLAGILAAVLMQAVTLGFFFWIMTNGSAMLAAIVSSFARLGNQASQAAGGSANMSPGDIFNAGLGIVQAVWGGMRTTTPGKDVLLAIAGVIIIIVFALVTGFLIEVIVESMFVSTVGLILLGMGGSSFTRNLAVAQFHLAISVGMKRLTLQVLVGLAETMIRGWAATPAGALDWTTIAVMVGAPVVLLRLATTLPQRAQDMIMGAHSGAAGGLGSTAGMVAAAAGGAAASAVGGGAGVAAAFREASATIAAREAAGSGGSISEGGGSGAFGRAMQVTGTAAKSLGRAAANDIGQRMSGSYAAQHGRMGWRMAASMNQSAATLRAAIGGSQAGMPAGTAQASGNQIGTP